MTSGGPAWIPKLGYLLKFAATACVILMGLYGFYLAPHSLAYGELFAVLGGAFFFDGFVADRVYSLMSLGRDWRHHFLPSLVIMNGGALWVLTTSQQSLVNLNIIGLLAFALGFMACLNQYLTAFEVNDTD